MTEWKTYRLGEIVATNKKSIGRSYPFSMIKYLDTGSITRNHIESLQEYKLSEAPSRAKRLVQEGDIIYSAVRPNQLHYGYISKFPENLVVSTGFIVISCNKDYIEPKFLYYLLTQQEMTDYLHSIADASTSAYPSLKSSDIENLEISLPSLEEQRRIAGILGAIDDKIENNRRINTNLELQAQALYKQWFVDNRCDDWEIKSLSDLMEYQGGSQPPASEFIDKPQDGYVRFVQIRDYASNSHPTYIPIAKKNKLCNKKDIMIARYGASLGRICFGLEGAYNVALAKVKPLENYYREFLRCYLSSNEFYDGINMKGNRAVQAGFNQSDINSFMISCPKQDIFVAFENIVSKILDKRLVLQQENETLATLRDTLLPKLMNGEIKTE